MYTSPFRLTSTLRTVNADTLQVLDKTYLLDSNANRSYLLNKTQHIIGGFGKLPGDPPGKFCLSDIVDVDLSIV